MPSATPRPRPRTWRSRLHAADSLPCELLEWDTEFWGRPIGRVSSRDFDATRVDECARSLELECLYYLAPIDDPAAVHAAERAGFRLMDVRVELARDAGDEAAPRVRSAVVGDRPALRAIAASSHGATRFYADPGFDDERCDDLYETWITRSLEGWADMVLVADGDGRPAGYVTCHLADGAGSIGLIAVDATQRTRGLGVELARAAVGWCAGAGAARLTVVTQGRNIPALRTFQRAGFLVSSIGLWLHKWYDR